MRTCTMIFTMLVLTVISVSVPAYAQLDAIKNLGKGSGKSVQRTAGKTSAASDGSSSSSKDMTPEKAGKSGKYKTTKERYKEYHEKHRKVKKRKEGKMPASKDADQYTPQN